MISKPKSQSVCPLLLAALRDLLMPLLPLELLLRVLERLHEFHVVHLLLPLSGLLVSPEVTVDVMVEAPVLVVGVLVVAAPQDERLVVGHS